MPIRREEEGRKHRDSADGEVVNIGTKDDIDQFVREVFQHEWSDYLDTYPPETGDRTWEWSDSGKPWGRLQPHVWRSGREYGLDLHFEHHPTAEQYTTGTLQFELHLEDCETGSADFSAETLHQQFRNRFERRAKRVKPALSERTEWRQFRITGSLDEHVLCRAVYPFTSLNERAYYETLRTAVEDHERITSFATDMLSELTQSMPPAKERSR
ncbi:hypothetical protein G3I44_15310 [Halogeometricum borinquense]|uniref:DUF4268 domain-containing protein n=1 Tax=Halogeometricum borinquense TaxID=60847 RepID=A0A6C0UMF2_9EURY|nr:hypothetical protein [Halogeometricum borinquense]QIB75541.1 hypothetical protein G3I44_15310 [Halogeometricum borinquense]